MKNFTRAMVSALVLALILSFSMAGVAQADSPARIAIVCSAAGQNDTGYNKSACDSIKQLATDLGIEYKIVEPTNGVAAALETLAEDGYNLIFNLEYDFDALVKGVGGADAIAAQYPDTWFVVFNADPNRNEDGSIIHKNVISVLFDVHEGSFLSGYTYVYMNENQKDLFGEGYNMTPVDTARAVGFVGGTNSDGILVFSYGFMQGMERACSELNVNYDYYAKNDAGFGDPALGATVAGTMFDNGANAVFAVAGVVVDGVASKAKEVGKLAVMVDGNLDAQQSGYIITSVLKNTGTPVATITKAYVDGSIGTMENLQSYNIASGGTGITDMSEIAGHVNADAFAAIKAKVDAVQAEIAAGTQKIINRQNGEEFDPATACPHLTVK